MKRSLIIAAVIVMGMVGMYQNVKADNSMNTKATVLTIDNVKFTEIKVDELPTAVSKSLSEGYSDYTIVKAYKGSDDSYKVDLKKDQETISVYFNADGKFLKIEKGTSEDSMQ